MPFVEVGNQQAGSGGNIVINRKIEAINLGIPYDSSASSVAVT
ncbi:hypothetical protein [Calycomorphotria hydatis]|nr:hypothetical protein [Calycomorphotria hydatis]